MKKIRHPYAAFFILLLLVGIICWFSGQQGKTSHGMNRMASEKIAAFVDNEMQLELTDKQHRSFVKNLDYPVRKLAHMAEFGAVGFVLFWIVGCYVKRGRFLVCIGILVIG